MDPRAEFVAACQAAVARFVEVGPSRPWEGSGVDIRGWSISYVPKPDGRDGPWKIVHDSHYVLSEEGTLYEHTRFWRDLQESPWTSTDIELSLYKIPMSILVGDSGASFSKWKSIIERAGY